MKYLTLNPELVVSQTGMDRHLHRPVRKANPIMVGDEPWEKRMIECNGRPVLFDEAANCFRMWYVSAWLEADAPAGCRYLTCYATSSDGIEWQKPLLGQRQWANGRYQHPPLRPRMDATAQCYPRSARF